jgi:hypothetical protein
MVASGRSCLRRLFTWAAPGSSTAPIEQVCTAVGLMSGSAPRRHSMSKTYDAFPSVPIVAIAVAVRVSVCGSPTILTPHWLRRYARTAPCASSPSAVRNWTGRPSRASATATLAALPPARFLAVPWDRATMSTSDSPTTRTLAVLMTSRKGAPSSVSGGSAGLGSRFRGDAAGSRTRDATVLCRSSPGLRLGLSLAAARTC